MLKLNLSKLSPELRSAARELLPQIGIQEADCGLTVESETWDKGLSVTAGDTAIIPPLLCRLSARSALATANRRTRTN